MAMVDEALHQALMADAVDRLLARRIDRRDIDFVRIIEAGRELLEQVA